MSHTHVSVSKVIICPLFFMWTNTDLSSMEPWGQIWITIQKLFLKKNNLNKLSASGKSYNSKVKIKTRRQYATSKAMYLHGFQVQPAIKLLPKMTGSLHYMCFPPTLRNILSWQIANLDPKWAPGCIWNKVFPLIDERDPE